MTFELLFVDSSLRQTKTGSLNPKATQRGARIRAIWSKGAVGKKRGIKASKKQGILGIWVNV